ncbi:hypothetical protein D3C80_1796370 [compost metagenome]
MRSRPAGRCALTLSVGTEISAGNCPEAFSMGSRPAGRCTLTLGMGEVSLCHRPRRSRYIRGSAFRVGGKAQ